MNKLSIGPYRSGVYRNRDFATSRSDRQQTLRYRACESESDDLLDAIGSAIQNK